MKSLVLKGEDLKGGDGMYSGMFSPGRFSGFVEVEGFVLKDSVSQVLG